MSAAHRPNLLLIVTDQQRYPRHWPEDSQWLRELMPANAELARTGLTFTSAFAATCMCSPSRATLFTGRYPARHGVTLTLTEGGARPDTRNLPAVVRAFADNLRTAGVPRVKAARAFVRGLAQRPGRAPEPELAPETPNLGQALAAAGYGVAYKGKWHLTKPLYGYWAAADAERLADEFGFGEWEPPDAGENVSPEHFGGGTAGLSGEGWDEDFTRQAERFLADRTLEEPFALVVSLVNPHDVLGYPSSYAAGGYRLDDFRDRGVGLPPTLREDLAAKPTPHALMRLGQAAYLGALGSDRERLAYVNFYAHLHSLVDAKIGRLLAALGDPGDPGSLRARTIVARTSDHGEMGLAHGGLRQKMFNTYEETIHVPLVISNPVLFPTPAETPALASLADLAPTLAALAGTSIAGSTGVDLTPVIAHNAAPDGELLQSVGVEFSAVTAHRAPGPSVQDAVHFTYDDHKAATFQDDVVPQPNRIRCVRDRRRKYAEYFDPAGSAATEYELYDLERDPDERENLVDRMTGEPHDPALRDDADGLRALLAEAAARHGRALGAPPDQFGGAATQR